MTVDERQSGPARLVTTNFTFIRFHLIGLRVRRVCPSCIKHGGRASILFNCVERLMKAEATETAFDVDWIVRLVGDRYRQRPSFFTSSLLRSLLFPLACRWPSDWYQLAVLWTFFIFIFSFFFSRQPDGLENERLVVAHNKHEFFRMKTEPFPFSWSGDLKGICRLESGI